MNKKFIDLSEFKIDLTKHLNQPVEKVNKINRSISYFIMDAKCFPLGVHNEDQLQYNSSYEWLMPAWVKLRGMELGNEALDYVLNAHKSIIAFAICFWHISVAASVLAEAIDWYTSMKTDVGK